MSEVERIVGQLQASMDGPAWHGPSVMETLEGIDARQAAARPIPKAHSIWEIVHHIAGWIDTVRRRLDGERVDEPEGGDFPIGTFTEARWTELKQRLRQDHDALIVRVQKMDDAELDRTPVPGGSTAYRQLHGAVQHNLYHAGQIGLLKKA